MGTNIFEQAARTKLRFTYNGSISAEQIWDLSAVRLNELYGLLMSQVRAKTVDTLMATQTAADKELELRVEIVKYVFAVKSAEAESRKAAAQRAAQRSRLIELKAQKQDEALSSMSMEEIDKLIAELTD